MEEMEKCGPPTSHASLKLDEESALWREAFETPRHAPLLSDLAKMYSHEVTQGKKFVLTKVNHSLIFGEFTRYGIMQGDGIAFPRDLAYRCSQCKIIIAGKPVIESDGADGLLYNCASCRQTMYDFSPRKESLLLVEPPPWTKEWEKLVEELKHIKLDELESK